MELWQCKRNVDNNVVFHADMLMKFLIFWYSMYFTHNLKQTCELYSHLNVVKSLLVTK